MQRGGELDAGLADPRQDLHLAAGIAGQDLLLGLKEGGVGNFDGERSADAGAAGQPESLVDSSGAERGDLAGRRRAFPGADPNHAFPAFRGAAAGRLDNEPRPGGHFEEEGSRQRIDTASRGFENDFDFFFHGGAAPKEETLQEGGAFVQTGSDGSSCLFLLIPATLTEFLAVTGQPFLS